MARPRRESGHVSRSCRALLVFLGVALASVPAAAEDAGDFLYAFVRGAVEELTDEEKSEAHREQRFRELLDDTFDVPAISKFILGVHWRRASKEDRSNFLSVFEDVVVQRFLPLFTSAGEHTVKKFSVTKVRRSKNNRETVFVTTKALRQDGKTVRLVWRLRQRDADYRILDISTEGLSMVMTLRQEYTSAIKTTGGLGGLVELLRRKVGKGAAAAESNGTN